MAGRRYVFEDDSDELAPTRELFRLGPGSPRVLQFAPFLPQNIVEFDNDVLEVWPTGRPGEFTVTTRGSATYRVLIPAPDADEGLTVLILQRTPAGWEVQARTPRPRTPDLQQIGGILKDVYQDAIVGAVNAPGSFEMFAAKLNTRASTRVRINRADIMALKNAGRGAFAAAVKAERAGILSDLLRREENWMGIDRSTVPAFASTRPETPVPDPPKRLYRLSD